MADFDQAIAKTLKWEGGWADVLGDPGGITNRGITWRYFQAHASEIGKAGSLQELRELTEEDAKTLYRNGFWNPIMGDQIQDQQFAGLILDWHINSDELAGATAISYLQHVLGIVADGVFGPATLAALNSAKLPEMYNAYLAARIAFYNHLADILPNLTQFRQGWLNRANDFVRTL